jgi:hypothetical protein
VPGSAVWWVPVALSGSVVVISLMPSPPNDWFWHMRVGQWIVESGGIPTTNRFAWTVPAETPYVYGAWLGGLLLYGLERLGGLELIIFVRNLLAAGLLVVVALECHRRTESWRWSALTVLGVSVLMLNNLAVRPQMFAWVPFALAMYLLGHYADGRLAAGWLAAALAALMAFWVNVHGSFVLGLALVGSYLAGALIHAWRDPQARTSGRYVGGLALGLGAMVLATFANPLGPAIYAYVHEALYAPSQRLIAEWQPPAPAGLVHGWFFLSILTLLAIWAHQRRPPAARDLILVCGMLWLAWSGVRYVLWYGVVVMPILAEGWARLVSPRVFIRTAPPPAWAGAILGMLLLIPVIVVQPWLLRSLRLGDAYEARMLPSPAPPLLTRGTPVAAIEHLRQNPGGRLFNEMGFGSYVIWALPEQRVFIDPRVVDLFPVGLWEDYRAIGEGREALQLLDRYGVDRVLLRRDTQANLSRVLQGTGAWEREYSDSDSEIWRRTEGARTSQAAARPLRRNT